VRIPILSTKNVMFVKWGRMVVLLQRVDKMVCSTNKVIIFKDVLYCFSSKKQHKTTQNNTKQIQRIFLVFASSSFFSSHPFYLPILAFISVPSILLTHLGFLNKQHSGAT
jgi:hypothetical protein